MEWKPGGLSRPVNEKQTVKTQRQKLYTFHSLLSLTSTTTTTTTPTSLSDYSIATSSVELNNKHFKKIGTNYDLDEGNYSKQIAIQLIN